MSENEIKQESEWLTLEQVEEEYPVDVKTLYRHIKKGTVPGYKPFGKILVKRKDIQTIFNRSRVRSA